MTKQDLLSTREVIEILEVPRETLHQWMETGRLRPVRTAGAPRFHPDDIRMLFEEQSMEVSERKGRILVIDDDPLVGQTLKNLLEKSGYEAAVASLGLAALDVVAREAFDLILTDIRMPGMNGIETLKAIRQIRSLSGKPPLPEIVITAYDDPEVREEARRLCIRDFIFKPFEIRELLTALEKILNPDRNKTVYAR